MALLALNDPTLREDAARFLERTQGLLALLRGSRVLVTGGTGFFGRWLLLLLSQAEAALGLGLQIDVLSRDPAGFCARNPELANCQGIVFHKGDVRDFELSTPPHDYIIHAAAEANAALNRDEPLLMFDTIVQGTRQVLEYARQTKPKRLLFVSSGAVYGVLPPEMTTVPEHYLGSPDQLSPGNSYAEGKRTAEHLCALYAEDFGLSIPIARCFAFLGPFLPLDRHFAAGNFIADALAGRPINVQGDGTPRRSYMYPTDLVEWLLTVLLRGESRRAYNIGSEEVVSIEALAQAVAHAAGGLPVRVAKEADPNSLPARYVPNTGRAEKELGLSLCFKLPQIVARTLRHHRAQQLKDS